MPRDTPAIFSTATATVLAGSFICAAGSRRKFAPRRRSILMCTVTGSNFPISAPSPRCTKTWSRCTRASTAGDDMETNVMVPAGKQIRSMPLLDCYEFLDVNGLTAEASKVRDASLSNSIFDRRVRRGMLLEILRAHGLLAKFVSEKWPYGATSAGEGRIEKYDVCYGEWKNSEGDDPEDPIDDGPGEGASQFAFEADLR